MKMLVVELFMSFGFVESVDEGHGFGGQVELV